MNGTLFVFGVSQMIAGVSLFLYGIRLTHPQEPTK